MEEAEHLLHLENLGKYMEEQEEKDMAEMEEDILLDCRFLLPLVLMDTEEAAQEGMRKSMKVVLV